VRRSAATAGTALALAAACAGCSGSSAAGAGQSLSAAPTATTSATTLPHSGGLVGAIDSARAVSLCTNVQLLATAVDGGLPKSSADAAFAGVLQVLRQAPVDPALVRLAQQWTRLRERRGDAVTAERLQAFCTREGG
jgi:hypothetical protein